MDGTTWRSVLLTLQIARTSLERHLRSTPFLVVAGFGLYCMFCGAYVFVERTSGDRRYPWIGVVWPELVESYHWCAALYLCYMAWRLVSIQRERRFTEIEDATPAPTWMLVASRLLPLVGVALAVALIPPLAAVVVQFVVGPLAVAAPGTAMLLSLLVTFPLYIQVAIIAFACYALVTNRWLAHFFAFGMTFAAAMNHSLQIGAALDLLQFAVDVHVFYSPLTGVGAWLEPTLALGLWFSSIAGLLVLIATWFYPRGTEWNFAGRLRSARAQAGPWLGAAALLLAVVGTASGAWCYRAVIVQNAFASSESLRRVAAEREKRFGHLLEDMTLRLDEVTARVHLRPEADTADIEAEAILRNDGDTPTAVLDFDVTKHLRITSVTVDGEAPARWSQEAQLRHDTVTLARPIGPGERVRVRLGLVSSWPGWGNHGGVQAVTRQGAWLREQEILPRLGYDRTGEVRGTVRRASYGLPPRALPRRSDRLAVGWNDSPVTWHLVVDAPHDLLLGVTGAPPARGHVEASMTGPLRFVVAAGRAYVATERTYTGAAHQVAIHVLHHPERAAMAAAFAEAAQESLRRLEADYGRYGFDTLTIVEAPAKLWAPGLYGDLLLLPEPQGWDSRPAQGDFDAALYQTSSWLATHWLQHRLRPTLTSGHSVLAEGLAIAKGLDTLEAVRGREVRRGHARFMARGALRKVAQSPEFAADVAHATDEEYVADLSGFALSRLRSQLSAGVLDASVQNAVLRADTSQEGTRLDSLLTSLRSRGAQSGADAVAAAFGPFRSIDVRLTRATAFPDGDGWQVEAALIVEAFVLANHEGPSWDPDPGAVDVPLDIAVRDPSGAEIGRTLSVGRPGARTVVWHVATKPSMVVADPARRYLDRSPDDDEINVVVTERSAQR